MTEKQALVVTTAHRGVFFGYGKPTSESTITLERCRMAVYWPSENHGVAGLAADGPKPGSRISPAVDSIILRDVTSVMIVNAAAAAQWEKELWKQ